MNFIFSIIQNYIQHAEDDGEESETSESGGDGRRREAEMEDLMLGGGLKGLNNLTEFKAADDAVGGRGELEDLTDFEKALLLLTN